MAHDTSREIDLDHHAPRVLVAEDDDRMRDLIATCLQRGGFEVMEVRDGHELARRLADLHLRSGMGRPVDLIVTDVRMPLISGLDILAELRRCDWEVPVIVITAFGDAATHEEASRLGAARVLDKPFSLGTLLSIARLHAGVGDDLRHGLPG